MINRSTSALTWTKCTYLGQWLMILKTAASVRLIVVEAEMLSSLRNGGTDYDQGVYFLLRRPSSPNFCLHDLKEGFRERCSGWEAVHWNLSKGTFRQGDSRDKMASVNLNSCLDFMNYPANCFRWFSFSAKSAGALCLKKVEKVLMF